MSAELDQVSQATDKLQLNRDCSVCVSYIGKQSTPILVIDQFWQTTDLLSELVTQGIGAQCFDTLHAKVSEVFKAELTLLLQQHLNSLVADVCVLPDEFKLLGGSAIDESQLPDIKNELSNHHVLVCFMSQAQQDGVRFYRHRKTGYETVAKQDLASYRQTLQAQIINEGIPVAEYAHADNNLFERTHTLPAWYNRSVIFPANLLHAIECPQGAERALSGERFTMSAMLKLMLRTDASNIE